MRRLVVASAILATLLTWPLAHVAAAPATQAATAIPSTSLTDSERATAALEYLLTAQRADGSLDKSLGETADFVIGAAAAGYDPATLHGCSGSATSALDYLATASDAATTDAAKTGKAVLAVVAAGSDPAAFQGRDLMARLVALYNSASGAYGDGSTFTEALAILAFRADGRDVPTAAVAELKALQDGDGSWSYGTAPVAAGQGDTNSTAIALMALDAAGDHSANATGLAYLRSQQLADGGFPYQNSSVWGPPTSDPDSDAIVIQALVAAGQKPEGPSWLQGSNSVLTHLRSSQVAGGGFAYPGQSSSAFTTSQVPAALMRVPYAVAVHPTSGRALPATACPRPTASPTARPTAKPTVKPPTRTKAPTAAPSPSTTPSTTPSPTPSPQVSASSSATPSESAAETASVATEVQGATSGPSGDATSGDTAPGSPPPLPLPYLLAAIVGLATVVGGGWVVMARSRRR